MTQPTPTEAETIEIEDTFADASLEMNAGGNGFRVAFALQDKLAALAPGASAAVGRLTVDTVLEVPTNVAYAANVTLDAAVKNDYTIGQLTGPCAITWSNPAAGRQGTVAVRQDATGNRAVTLTAPGGWTLMRDAALADLAASQPANTITLYTWSFVSVGGANVLLCSKVVAA